MSTSCLISASPLLLFLQSFYLLTFVSKVQTRKSNAQIVEKVVHGQRNLADVANKMKGE